MIVAELPQDEVLLQQILEQDTQGIPTPRCRTAFESLYERYKNPVLTYVSLHGIAQYQTAEDLTQEIFFKVWRGLSKKSPDAPFRRWLFAIATNEINSHFRSLRLKKNAALVASLERVLEKNPGALPPSTAPAIDDYLVQREQITEILAELPRREMQCLVLIDRYGFSAAEAASILGIKENSATGALSRARRRFTKHYRSLDQTIQ